ncbi:MAG: cytidine deaminase [Bacteroidota bacterium]|nr:cytidine deaminase [Bacteroidota bacterium]
METLSQLELQLAENAKQVSAKSYSPYSKFPVGCAVLDESGNIYTGCNVENVSLGLSVCAERNAVFTAVSQVGKGLNIKLVVIYTPTSKPTTPCGACRQVLQEFSDSPKIICTCESDHILISTLRDLFHDPPEIEW